MALPLLSYPTTSQNQRVNGFEIPGDEQPWQYCTETGRDRLEMDALIMAAYRRIFNEQQVLANNREPILESQLRSGQLTVRDFIRGLLLSETFRRRNYDCNNNYRFAQICIQRVLGRDIYDSREQLAWSTVIATQGLAGFIDRLLNSEEYLENFGTDTVPYQRRRSLPHREIGQLPFERMPRYGADHLSQLEALGNDFSRDRDLSTPAKLPPDPVLKIGAAITIFGALALTSGIIAVVLSWFGWIKI